MESPNEVARTAEAQQARILMHYVATRAGEVTIEVPDEPSIPAHGQSNPSSNASPHLARPTVPLLSQLRVRAPQQQNSFYNAVQGGSDTPLWNYFGLLLLTIASLFVGQFVYNHLTGIFLAFLLVVATNYAGKYLTVITQTRMLGEKVCAGHLFRIYVACGLGLFFICLFTPFSLITSCLLLMPSIEPLDLLNVLYTGLVVSNFIQLSAKVIVSTVIALPFRRSRVMNIALGFEAVTQVYVLLPDLACWITYFISIESLILKIIIMLPFLLFSVVAFFIRVHVNYKSLFVWFKRWNTFGSSVSHSVAEEAGGTCAVCLESYQHPIKLKECGHIFCEECIMLWLLRQSTCPLCRKPVFGTKSKETV